MGVIETVEAVALPQLTVVQRALSAVRRYILPIIAGVLILVLLGFAANLLWEHFTGATRKQTEAKLDGAQTVAARESGHDAVQTVQTNTVERFHTERIVERAQAAINAAPDAVAADDAGRAGLCSVTTYYCPAPGMQ